METLKKYLKEKNIKTSLEGETREDVYLELLTLLEKGNEIQNKDSILKSIIEWDKVVDSHRGKSVVIVRLPLDTQKKIALTIGVKKEGLDEEVFDRERTKIFVIIITPETGNEEYINLVSEISSLLNQGSIREDILDEKDQEKVVKILLGQ
ncbi:PTS sugar transporter subunit IIA [candidate division WOR-3 bacterium]|nr:PTS sugar transporter subunit IIA [candidate division WOR-3 bacterium]